MPSYVIVGASRGLGYAWLRTLSKDPSNTVIGTARTPSSTKARLEKDKITNVNIVAGDMADAASMTRAAVETAKITGGALDYLIVNGAFVSPTTAFMKPTDFAGHEAELAEDFKGSFEVNVVGVIYAVNSFLPLIRKGVAKKIVCISTGMADLDLILYSGTTISVPYSATKAALNVVVGKFSQELKSEGIIIFSMSPGLVNTRETEPTPEEIKDYQNMVASFKKLKPDFERALEPEESVDLQKKVIDNITIEQTGAFLSHWGNKQWL